MVVDSTAFDAFAADYDVDFTHTQLGQLLRQRVWDVLAQEFKAGDRVLELACGTGEDAVWMAQRGIQVLATDGSAEMLSATAHKTHTLPVETQQLSLQQIIEGELSPQDDLFSGVLSNFGGLNTINQWEQLATALSKQVKPGGKLVLVPMGPHCPIETLWYGLHGQLRNATRRYGKPATATIGNQHIPIWYPSLCMLKQAFAPTFKLNSVQSLGLWLPPSYLGHWVEHRPSLWRNVARFETATARFTRGLGDHYITVFEKN